MSSMNFETELSDFGNGMTKVYKMSIDSIKVKSGRRPINQKKVKKLAESIEAIGLLNPITINVNQELIAGEIRLEAMKQLGLQEVETRILDITGLRAELAEIDENFIRQELNFIERGKLAIRRDKILEELGLRAKQGDNRFTNRGEKNAPLKTTEDIAAEIGVSKRTLQQEKQIAKNLIPEAKEVIVNHNIPKDQALELSRLGHGTQNEVADMIKTSQAKDVREAMAKKLLGALGKDYFCIVSHSCSNWGQGILAKDSSILFFWSTDTGIWYARSTLKKWGFNYQQFIVWDKGEHCEFCLVGIKGKPLADNTIRLPYIIREPEGERGQKPEVFYKMVDSICKDEGKIEFCPNEKREGYDIYEVNSEINITIPDEFTSIADNEFANNKLKSVNFGDSVISIGEGAFAENQLTSVAIPDSITMIGDKAFAKNQLTSITIGNRVISIGEFAFYGNQLTSVIISDSVISIGKGVFAENQLTSVIISDSVISIGQGAFYGNQLTNVTIPNSITSIESNSFDKNQLTSVIIPDSVISIGDFAFAENKLTSVNIGNSVNSIGKNAFAYNQLTSVIIPDSVTKIGVGAFSKNKLTSVNIGNSVNSIEDYVFAGNQLSSITIPDSVTKIGVGAFAVNKLTSIIIPDSVESIDSGAFVNNPITSVIIPDSVKSISFNSFNMEILDEKSKQSVQAALERVEDLQRQKNTGKMVILWPFKKDLFIEHQIAEFQKIMQTTGINYLLLDNVVYFDLWKVEKETDKWEKVREWLDKNHGFYKGEGCGFTESSGYLTKDGFIGRYQFKELEDKPKKLTVEEYKKTIKNQ